MCQRNINPLLLARPQLGTWPTNQACAPTGNQTGDLLVCRPALNPLSHTSLGYFSLFFWVRGARKITLEYIRLYHGHLETLC